MENSSAQHHQVMNADQTLENMLVCPKAAPQQDRKPRPQPEQALKCPRCDSTNTKFCYYNNYSLSQPRYFCKSCRRYWTKGGTLRNVPVGGGCRKNRRSSSSSKHAQDHHNQQVIMHNNSNPLATALSLPSLEYDHHHSNDLSLAFARLQKQSSAQFVFENHDFPILGGGMNPSQGDVLENNSGFLESLRNNGFLDTQGNNNLHSFYYGHGGNNGSIGEGENRSGEMGVSYDEMGGNGGGVSATTSAVTTTTMKQEPCSTGMESENKVLWGFPWQMNSNNNVEINYMGDFENSTRGSTWNGLNYSSWHGLLNSPLM